MMKEYDVLITGGGVAGSVTAKFLAKGGLNVLLIEKYKTPRKKACSGIQFGYLEKIIGEKIPKERLCDNKINRVKIQIPSGWSMSAPFKIFNFMRDTFDDWLNKVAIEYGAEFRDECEMVDWENDGEIIVVSISNKNKEIEQIKTKYLVDASGLRPKIRMKLQPEHFGKGSSGAAVNYYLKCESELQDNKLYMFYNIDFNNMMFAWIYKKSDLWCIGTGYDKGVAERGKNFLDFAMNKYNIKGEVVKKEGYTTNIDFTGESKVWLGQGRILMVGDAAGLIDLHRGVGIDAAALSGRLLAKAILKAENEGKDALEIYTKLMKKLVKMTEKNQNRGIYRFKTNEELQKYLKFGVIKMGLKMLIQTFLNWFRNAENVTLLPP